MSLNYRPDGDTLRRFISSNAPVCCIQGPVGSGTSTASLMKMMRHSMEQKANPDGIRKSRWFILRPDVPTLKTTFIKTTFIPWLRPGEGCPDIVWNPYPVLNIPPSCPRAHMPDGTKLDISFEFRGLDPDAEDYYEWDSTEMTGIFVNEAQDYANKAPIDAILGRVSQGRYPNLLDGGPTWHGLIMDMNAPSEQHWINYMRGDVPMPEEWTDAKRLEYKKPDDWEFYIQPAGLIEKFDVSGKLLGYEENPLAENAKFRKVPYIKQIEGQSGDFINTKIMNRVGMVRRGEPVFEAFSADRNVSDKITPSLGVPLTVGMDAARNPFAVIGQNVRGSWRIYGEFYMRNVSAVTFFPALKRHIMENYPEFVSEDANGRLVGVNMWCDPSATRRGDGTDDSFWSIGRGLGLSLETAPGNNTWDMRRNAVESSLMRITPNGDMGLLVAKSCVTLKNAMNTGYVLGDDNMPNKKKSGIYAEAADALQYLLLGGGEGNAIVGQSSVKRGAVNAGTTRKRRGLPRRGG